MIDKTVVTEKEEKRLKQSVATAMQQGDGLLMILDAQTESVRHYSKRLMCPVTGLSYREPAPHNFLLTLRKAPVRAVRDWDMSI